MLCIVDDCTGEALALVVDTSIGGRRLARELDAIIARQATDDRERQSRSDPTE